MVTVKLREKYHGTTKTFNKEFESIDAAKKFVREWNQFDNPEEKITIIGVENKGFSLTAWKW